MPNQNNFRSNIVNNTEPRFLASRVVKSLNEGILFEQIPASFGYEPTDYIEVHFYTKQTNSLILSTTIAASDADILKSHVVSYPDGTLKNYIRIDFTELFKRKQLILIPGDYKLVLNFFSNEIGDYNNKKMYIDVISNDRTEIQIAFRDNIDSNGNIDANLIANNDKLLYEFVEKGFDKVNAVGAAEKIFLSGVQTENSDEGLTYDNIVGNIYVARTTPNEDQTVENTIDRIENLGENVIQQFEQEINNFLPKLFETVREEIIINGDKRIQEEEFKKIIDDAIRLRLNELQAAIDSRIELS